MKYFLLLTIWKSDKVEHKAMDVWRGSEQYVRPAERVTLALLRRQLHNGLFQKSSVSLSQVATAPSTPPPQRVGIACFHPPFLRVISDQT